MAHSQEKLSSKESKNAHIERCCFYEIQEEEE